jgi:hypothetical protein
MDGHQEAKAEYICRDGDELSNKKVIAVSKTATPSDLAPTVIKIINFRKIKRVGI